MKSRSIINRQGVTLIELMITISIAWIVLFAVGVYIVDMQRGYGRMYGRVHGNLVRDAYVARRAFDGVVRKSARNYTVDPEGQWLTMDYWEDDEQELPDCTATFYREGTQLVLGTDLAGSVTTETLANNVIGCEFCMTGPSAQMILKLDDPDDNRGPVRIVSSAVQHNQEP